jgi:hypothetical protein
MQWRRRVWKMHTYGMPGVAMGDVVLYLVFDMLLSSRVVDARS